MNANLIAAIVFASTSCGAVLGMFIAKKVPHHLSSESRDVIKLALGTVATLSALVIGLLISTEKNFPRHQGQRTEGVLC